ncbi:hypothetical protein GBA52_004128 [Prunus armeniaca]|nr:hypothetical protein GBA52_004128 [Prunus armeniaca]
MGGGWGNSTWKKWYDNCLSDQWKNGSKKKSDANGGKKYYSGNWIIIRKQEGGGGRRNIVHAGNENLA